MELITMLQRQIQSLLVICLLFLSFLSAEENEAKTHEYSQLKLTELHLENGMRVILKQTDDEDEVSVRLVALGGFSSLAPNDRASGELAAAIVMESGIENLSADKFSALLYNDSIEFNLKIEPFTRGIDASLPEESLATFFDIVNKTFTAPHFNSEAFIAVIAKKKCGIARKKDENRTNDILELISSDEKKALSPLKLKDLDGASLKKSKQFFEGSFANPADFICIIAGNFNIEKVKKLTSQYLANIPKKATTQKFSMPRYTQAPKSIATKVQNLPNSQESIVRLAFPLNLELDITKLEQLEIICQIIEIKLRNRVKSPEYNAKGVDIWYELPLYPSVEYPWMTIQFYVDNPHIKPVIAMVFEELKRLKSVGVSQDEIQLAAQMKKQSLDLWQHDNDFWIVLLSNYYLWGWDPQSLSQKFSGQTTLDLKEIQSMIRSSLSIEECNN